MNAEKIDPPLGSLIICTRNRADKLGACLDSLQKLQGLTQWEIVLVDNGSTDATPTVLETFRSAAPHRVTIVHEAVPGLGRARNAGVAAAGGAILAFTDDDCYPEPDFLLEIESVFEDPQIGYMGGRILLFNELDAPVTIRVQTDPLPIPAGGVVRTGVIQGANMACRRSVIEAAGDFDTDFGAGTPFPAEDVEFVTRASIAGWGGGYFPGPVVHHDHGRRGLATIRRLFRQYDRGRGAYYAKFILRGDTRAMFLRRWFWSLNFRRGKRRLFQELVGATHYAITRAARGLGVQQKPD